jgi:aminopeptidase
MTSTFERTLQNYGELAVKVGLNLRAGQRLLIIGPIANGGVSLEAAPLVRAVTASAYKAGSPLVETLWGDEAMQIARFRHAPRDAFNEFSAWLPRALADHVTGGHAVLSVNANDPDLLKDEPPDLIGAVQRTVSRCVHDFREQISRNQTNWSVIAAPSLGWAAKVFPDLPPDRAFAELWDAIIRLCRLDRPDPLAAWQTHLDMLAARRDLLNRKQYSTLRYSGPGTNLTIGLPAGHVWVSGQSVSASGILFAPNLPTEEVFTMPHKDRVDGTIRASKPLSYGGTLIDGFTLHFEGGRIVRFEAKTGEAVLRQLIETDPGAARLGELALVPHGSPVSQSRLLFYNTLFDENAASHVALGSAYKFTLAGGETMEDEAFQRAGGNHSAVHVDFMLGNGELDVDGVLEDGRVEPLMRSGDWADPRP